MIGGTKQKTPVRSVVDLTAVANLAKVNGDLWTSRRIVKILVGREAWARGKADRG
jgi:hypothetical protein